MAKEFIPRIGTLVRPKAGAKLANPVWNRKWYFVGLVHQDGEIYAELKDGWSGSPHAFINPFDLEIV